MEGTGSPDAKRARIDADLEIIGKETSTAGAAAGAAAAEEREATPASRSMTARSRGAAAEGEYDPIFDDPVVGDEITALMGEPPSVSAEEEVEKLRLRAVKSPETLRAYIADRAKELAIAAGCPHQLPLVTYKEDPVAARTCGQHQASLLGNVDLQVSNAAGTAVVCLREKSVCSDVR